MFSYSRPFILALTASVLCAVSASAATYYVDFASGDNAANGRSQQTAWQHSPGDQNATGKPAGVTVAPGDTIIFRGGVAYHGSISLSVSGGAGKPITLDANTAGTFGEGRAILDGGRVIENWQRCKSADDAEGNPRWREIFYADVDVDISSNFNHGQFVAHRQVPSDIQAPWQRVILYDGDRRLLPISQSPKPSDSFYPDIPGDFYRSKNRIDVREEQGISVITDEVNLVATDASYYDGTFIGFHGGNNHVYFAAVKGYNPNTHQLTVPQFKPRTYNTSKYAFYNSARLIELPGEWSIKPIGKGHSRIYLLPDRLQDGQPANIGFPVFETGISLNKGASHLQVKGFLIQRYSGGAGGVSVSRNNPRSKDIVIADCEIRFVSGHAGVGLNHCDDIVVENCYIHQCPGWTTGVFLSRVNNYTVRNCRLDKNSGSGIRHYECKEGVIRDNVILDHFGMHSSGINVYEGCYNVLLEGNYIQNVITINRNAENIIFRNNVIDSMNKTAVCLAIWASGSSGGREIKNIQFLNNTFVNANSNVKHSTGIFGQRSNAYSSPEGLIIRNNILSGIRDDISGVIENNIYTRKVEKRFLGPGCSVIEDMNELFVDPANGDFQRRPGGADMNIGANIPAPPAGR